MIFWLCAPNLPTGITVESQNLIHALSIAIFASGPNDYLEIEINNNQSMLHFFIDFEKT